MAKVRDFVLALLIVVVLTGAIFAAKAALAEETPAGMTAAKAAITGEPPATDQVWAAQRAVMALESEPPAPTEHNVQTLREVSERVTDLANKLEAELPDDAALAAYFNSCVEAGEAGIPGLNTRFGFDARKHTEDVPVRVPGISEDAPAARLVRYATVPGVWNHVGDGLLRRFGCVGILAPAKTLPGSNLVAQLWPEVSAHDIIDRDRRQLAVLFSAPTIKKAAPVHGTLPDGRHVLGNAYLIEGADGRLALVQVMLYEEAVDHVVSLGVTLSAPATAADTVASLREHVFPLISAMQGCEFTPSPLGPNE